MAQGDSSPWVHALRLLILMAVVMAVAALVRHWAALRGRKVAHHAIGRFLLAKVTLVALAMAAGLALDTSISHADAWVSVGLAAVVALGGPIIHPWLVKTRAVEDHPTAAAVAV